MNLKWREMGRRMDGWVSIDERRWSVRLILTLLSGGYIIYTLVHGGRGAEMLNCLLLRFLNFSPKTARAIGAGHVEEENLR